MIQQSIWLAPQNSLINLRIESRGFRPASQVVQAAQGDSTDHAILLAALLRSKGIASQVAFGLKYVVSGKSRAMVYHAWTLAYVDDRWLHVDATIGDVAPADRLMLSASSLSEGNEYDALVPLSKWRCEHSGSHRRRPTLAVQNCEPNTLA